MSRFSPQDLDDIKARNPLADVAGGYVKLRRAGGRLVGGDPAADVRDLRRPGHLHARRDLELRGLCLR